MISDTHGAIESSHAEAFYFQKQIQQQTEMSFILEDGEELHGVIEWYDKCVIKIKNGRSRVMIYKAGIKYLFKTVRKFFGEAIVVTQEVEDIISSPVVKQAIINNSDCKILLDQSKYQNKFDQIQELLGLTEKEKALVLSINKANDPTKKYKEVFISLGGTLSRVYRTEVSPEEYLAYTTEETEKIKVTEYAKKYGSIEKGISMLTIEMP